jgi:tetratricopeptide (TPR) repeat protein
MRAAIFASLLLLGGAVPSGAAPGEKLAVPGSPAPDIMDQVALGVSLTDAGRYDDAIQAFDAALARIPSFGPALANRALAYAWTNRLDEATRDLDAAARTMPDDALVHRVRAVIAERRSDVPTQIAELSRSLELEPGDPLALRFRARVYQRVGNHAAALADAETYIAARPRDTFGYILKADLLIGQHERQRAEQEAALLLSLFPENDDALASAARIYDELADRDRAMAAINRVVDRNPDSFSYLVWRAGFRRWNDFSGRRADLEAALSSDPENNGIITDIALLDFKERKWSDAIGRFSTVLELEPRDFGILAYRALAHLNAGDRALAERDFRSASTAASGADDFSVICGVFAHEGGALDWGMETCNRAVQLNGNESRYRSNRGLVELRLGQLDAALADYNAAVEADGRRADGYYGRALVFHRRGAQQEAAADRRQALAIDPGIGETYQEYGFTDF